MNSVTSTTDNDPSHSTSTLLSYPKESAERSRPVAIGRHPHPAYRGVETMPTTQLITKSQHGRSTETRPTHKDNSTSIKHLPLGTRGKKEQ